jgi:hypothetical protein
MIIIGLEFGAVFVERDGMSEVANRSIGGSKWEGARHYPDGANRIPRPCNTVSAKLMFQIEKENIPYADKFYLNIN